MNILKKNIRLILISLISAGLLVTALFVSGSVVEYNKLKLEVSGSEHQLSEIMTESDTEASKLKALESEIASTQGKLAEAVSPKNEKK